MRSWRPAQSSGSSNSWTNKGNVKAVKRELQHYDESADRLLADVITELL
jgi:hypothetical protein